MTRAKGSILMMLLTLVTGMGMMAATGGETVHVPTTTVQLGQLVQTTALTGVVSHQHRQPMIAAYDGRVARVYVRAGDRVQKGQLLMRLDTTAEENLLSQIQHSYYGRMNGMTFLDGEIASLAQMQQPDWLQTVEQLQQRIQLAQIRASSDGVIESLYCTEGDYVSASAVLGMTRGEQKCLLAMQNAEMPAYAPGTAAFVEANGQRIGTAVLNGVKMAGEQAVQLCFVPVEEDVLAHSEIGEMLTLLIEENDYGPMALLPLTAVNADEEVWTIEDGKAFPVSVSTAFRNERYIGLPSEWLGKKIVLHPDAVSLYSGCMIDEADAR